MLGPFSGALCLFYTSADAVLTVTQPVPPQIDLISLLLGG